MNFDKTDEGDLMMKIGLIGAGALGEYLLDEQGKYGFEVTAVLVRNREKYAELASHHGFTLFDDVEAFLEADFNMAVEVAGVPAALAYGLQAAAKKNLLIISIGAFADTTFAATIEKTARDNGHTIYLPSGAIGGLDTVQNARDTGQLESVTIETRKPAASLVDEPLTEERLVFDGVARDAIALFPKNVNISIALSLAGLGVDQTTVRLIADPNITTNQHKITAKGPFGQAIFQLINEPLPSNPKSSYITAMSIIGTLERIGRTIQIG